MSDDIHVFAGPSMPPAARSEMEGVTFHGPVAQGDVYRLVTQHPAAIAIIDGYFERIPTVWHKEILWALSQGVHVLGAASMGALRAAELAVFGMRGVGKIFRDFRDGVLTDDDEVTIVHASSEFDYRPASEALVNMRATLDRATQESVLGSASAMRLIELCKKQFYPDRNYRTLLAMASDELDGPEYERLGAWLENPEHRVDQKRSDALELLDEVRRIRDAAPERPRVSWKFQHTDAWEQVRRTFPRGAERRTTNPTELGRRFGLDEAAMRAVEESARLRALEVSAALRDGYEPSRSDLEASVAAFCRARRLEGPGALRSFLAEHGVSERRFEEWMKDDACVRRARLVPGYDLQESVLDLLTRRYASGLEPPM